jgi:ribosomal protein L11 methyltransferase
VSDLRRVSVRTRRDDAELLRVLLLDLVPAGIEERETGDAVELVAYVVTEELDELLSRLPGATVETVEEGWDDAWRAFHGSVEVAGIWLGPPWETPPDPARAVVIDPGRAFGTGAHPTTRLCVELLAGLECRGSLLDVGCGSGVLGLAGARLGFGPVACVDLDPVAVETTLANAAGNGVDLAARLVDALTEPLPAADVAVANVLLAPVEAILGRLDTAVAITSGYLQGERPGHPGWAHLDSAVLDGWAADRFHRVG